MRMILKIAEGLGIGVAFARSCSLGCLIHAVEIAVGLLLFGFSGAAERWRLLWRVPVVLIIDRLDRRGLRGRVRQGLRCLNRNLCPNRS